MSEPTNDFQYERRFFCHALPAEYRRDNPPKLVIQSYYVHSGNYVLRVRLTSNSINLTMDCDTYPIDVLHAYRDEFSHAYVTVKGPASLGTRYEKEMEVDTRIAAELVRRGGDTVIKNRYSVWIAEDGWNVDVFGATNAPLIVAEAARSGPVTNLTIPKFCLTEVTDQPRFSNESLAARPFSRWAGEFEAELSEKGPSFQQVFGTNRIGD